MNKIILKKDTLLFICSPSLGIIDSWLPVLKKIKELNQNASIVCVIPKTRTIEEIDLNTTLIRVSDEVFNNVIFYSSIGRWIIVKNFSEAIRLETLTNVGKIIHKIRRRLPSNRLFSLPDRALKSIQKFPSYLKLRKKLFSWEENSGRVKAILFDVYVEKKDQVGEILKHFDTVFKYSISHGLKVKNINKWSGGKTQLKNNLIAYIQSEHEREFFRDRFGVPEKNQKVVGVPRHQPDWIRHLIEKEQNTDNKIGDDFIFVISRPHTTDYHTRERMHKALQHVKKLAWEYLDKRIVVKLHPKEKTTGIYEEVFGEEHYGEKWIYSNLHPLALGDKCLFAIAFYSGVVIDMIAMDVPTIELLDLRGLPKYDNEKSLRDKNGDPVFEYRYNSLTLGANEYEDLKKQTDRILNNREKVISELKENYSKLYQTVENVREKIANDILGR